MRGTRAEVHCLVPAKRVPPVQFSRHRSFGYLGLIGRISRRSFKSPLAALERDNQVNSSRRNSRTVCDNSGDIDPDNETDQSVPLYTAGEKIASVEECPRSRTIGRSLGTVCLYQHACFIRWTQRPQPVSRTDTRVRGFMGHGTRSLNSGPVKSPRR